MKQGIRLWWAMRGAHVRRQGTKTEAYSEPGYALLTDHDRMVAKREFERGQKAAEYQMNKEAEEAAIEGGCVSTVGKAADQAIK